MKLVGWIYCKNLNEVNDILLGRSTADSGETFTADDIISIVFKDRCYEVFYRYEKESEY